MSDQEQAFRDHPLWHEANHVLLALTEGKALQTSVDMHIFMQALALQGCHTIVASQTPVDSDDFIPALIEELETLSDNIAAMANDARSAIRKPAPATS